MGDVFLAWCRLGGSKQPVIWLTRAPSKQHVAIPYEADQSFAYMSYLIALIICIAEKEAPVEKKFRAAVASDGLLVCSHARHLFSTGACLRPFCNINVIAYVKAYAN